MSVYQSISVERAVHFKNGKWEFQSYHTLPFIPRISETMNYGGVFMKGRVSDVIYEQTQDNQGIDVSKPNLYGVVRVIIEANLTSAQHLSFDEDLIEEYPGAVRYINFAFCKEQQMTWDKILGFRLEQDPQFMTYDHFG